MAITDLIAVPKGINTGVSSAKQMTMLTLLGNPRGTYDQTCRPVQSLCVSDTSLAVATSDQVRFHDLTGDQARVRVAKLSDLPLATAFSPNGGTLAITDQQGNINGSDTATGKHRWKVESGGEWISNLYLTDSGIVCTVSEDDLSVYDVGIGKRFVHLRSENRWGDFWMPDSAQTVLVGGIEGRLHRLSRNATA